MPDNSRNLRNQNGGRSLERRRRRLEVFLPAEEADHIGDANFADAAAIDGASGCDFGVVAAPDAEIGLAEPLQRRQGLTDGGGDGKRPKRRLSKAYVGDLAS